MQFGSYYDYILTSDPSLGYNIAGRSDASAPLSGNTVLALTLTGLNPSLIEVYYDWWVPNLNDDETGYTIPVAGGTLTDSFEPYDLENSAEGDQAYAVVSTLSPIFSGNKAFKPRLIYSVRKRSRHRMA